MANFLFLRHLFAEAEALEYAVDHIFGGGPAADLGQSLPGCLDVYREQTGIEEQLEVLMRASSAASRAAF